MFGSSRRKAGFDDFAKRRAPMRFRALMTAKNRAAVPPGFERTVATRDVPLLMGEIAGAQSLRESRRLLSTKPGLGARLHRPHGFFKGDEA